MSKTTTVDPATAQAAREGLLQARREAEEAKATFGLSISRSVSKGKEIARKTFGSELLLQDLGSAMSKGINPNISVTATGLVMALGYKPTEQEVTEAVSGLCGINEEAAKFKTALTWAIGDAALLAEGFEGGVDRVVSQAISERGLTKHTVMKAILVCRRVPFAQRIPGVSFTHHSELVNYNEGIKDREALAKIVADLRQSADDDDIMPCHELRDRLSAISTGYRKKKTGDPLEPGSGNYLYINEDSEVFRSGELDLDACASGKYLVVDVTGNQTLEQSGKPYYTIPELTH